MSEPLEIQETQTPELSETLAAVDLAKNEAVSAPTHCANCETQLAGNYCHECGQTAHVHRSISHMFEELLHGVLHFDSKAWRTLPALIIHPGKLTRDYINGKRTRYVSPLFLFLFLNLVMFVALSYLGSSIGPEKSYKSLIKGGMVNEINNIQTRLNDLNVKQQALPANDPNLSAITREIEQLKQKQAGVQKSLAATKAEDDIDVDVAPDNAQSSTSQSTDQQAWLERNINHALQNPDLVLYKMKGTASKFAFILIPISLPFLWLLFIRRKDVVLFDHCIFSLYSLSFICLLIMLVAAFIRLGWESWSWLLILVVPPVHMFAQLRGTYQLSIGSALWRTFVLLVVAGFALCVYFVAITWLSL